MIIAASDQAEIIRAIALLVMAITGAVVGPMIVIRAHRLSADMKGMKLSYDTQATVVASVGEEIKTKISEVKEETSEINTAVNRKEAHEPTLVKRVAKLESTVDEEVVPAVRHLVKSDRNRLEWQRKMSKKLGIEVNEEEQS